MKHNDPAFDGLQPWPDTLSEQYCKAGVWGSTNLAGWLDQKLAKRYGDIALSGPGFPGQQWQTLCGYELLQQVRQLALGLQALGLSPGDRVVLQMANNNAFVITLFALFELGVIPVMALPGHRHLEIQHFVRLTKARAWLASDAEAGTDFRDIGKTLRKTVPELEHIIIDTELPGSHLALASLLDSKITHSPSNQPAQLQPQSAGHAADPAGIALLLCSGGTTGLPKLIPRTHRDYLYNAKASAELCELTPKDSYMVSLPAAHNFALACPGILGAFDAGAGVVMCPVPSPEIAFEYIERTSATVTALVPPLVPVWLDHAANVAEPPSSLRLLQVGGAKLEARQAKRIGAELGCSLQQVFGMAEGLLNYTRLSDPNIVINKTQGRPLSHLDEIRVVDADGKDVAPGTQGELWTRGPYTLRGYYKNEKANRRSFSADGYYCSGDLVRQLSSGHLIVEGRIREVIRRGAETVPIETLEALLITHPTIDSVAVVGLPCDRLGEQVCAVIVLNKANTSAPSIPELRGFLTAQGVARFMLPDSLEVVDQLPLTAVGKIARQQLVAQIIESRQQHQQQHQEPSKKPQQKTAQQLESTGSPIA